MWLRSLMRRFSSMPSPPQLKFLHTPSDMDSAREWITNFRKTSVPRDAVDLTFSRSSGPGGQNVNKVNTKATVRCSLNVHWIPMWARDHLKLSPSYVVSTHSLLVTSTAYRSQAQNIQDCLAKLHALILDASMTAVKNEPSDAQRERVRRLVKAESTKRRQDKSFRSRIKRARSKGDDSS